ncbi:MAG: universal stress protein [Salinirussus sp.]
MIETVVVGTDGSGSAERAVRVAADLAARFDATVHAVYVVDEGHVDATPADVREAFEDALETAGDDAVTAAATAAETAGVANLTTAVREGNPATELCAYAREVDADLISTGTRGRHGEHSFLLGSVAEAVVRRSDLPVLTARQLEGR